MNDEYINKLKVLMHSGNPMQFLSQAAMYSPQLQQAIRLMQSGVNPKSFFENLAHQQGYDPNYIINKLTS